MLKKKQAIIIGAVSIIVILAGAVIYLPSFLAKQTAKSAVEKNLIDPTSPLYRNLVFKTVKGTDEVVVCGEVNAKNRIEPPRVSRRPNFLREYPNEKYLLT